MTEPRSPGGDLKELRAALLRSGRSEKPTQRALQRTLIAIGVGAAGSVGTAGSVGAAGSVLARSLFWKWLGIGIVSGVVGVGAYKVTTPSVQHTGLAEMSSAIRSKASSPASSPSRVPLAPATSVDEPAPPIASASEAQGSGPSVAPSPIGVSVNRSDNVPVLPIPSVIPSAHDSGLAEEIAMLDEARRAVSSGDPSSALQALDRHARVFPSSQLDHEAAVLRVEALLSSGQCEAARAQAAAFLRANPRSSVAQRMQSLLGRPCSGP